MKYFLLFFISFSLLAADSADVAAQKTTCAANSANEWSDYLNRCVTKQQAIEVRNKVQECNKIPDLPQRQDCHMQLANSTTGLSTADASASLGKISDLQSKSALINTANTILMVINLVASPSKDSSCMCKKIFGITAVAGTLSDIYLKIKTHEALDGLKNQYTINLKTTAYDAQKKALEYLRDEQKTVAEIAALEKKRQMLLMIGYGAAALTAAFEMATDAACYKPETSKPDAKTDTKTPEAAAADTKPAETKPAATNDAAATEPVVKAEPAAIPPAPTPPPATPSASGGTISAAGDNGTGTRVTINPTGGGVQNVQGNSIYSGKYMQPGQQPVGSVKLVNGNYVAYYNSAPTTPVSLTPEVGNVTVATRQDRKWIRK